jgi:hypothetical protein
MLHWLTLTEEAAAGQPQPDRGARRWQGGALAAGKPGRGAKPFTRYPSTSTRTRCPCILYTVSLYVYAYTVSLYPLHGVPLRLRVHGVPVSFTRCPSTSTRTRCPCILYTVSLYVYPGDGGSWTASTPHLHSPPGHAPSAVAVLALARHPDPARAPPKHWYPACAAREQHEADAPWRGPYKKSDGRGGATETARAGPRSAMAAGHGPAPPWPRVLKSRVAPPWQWDPPWPRWSMAAVEHGRGGAWPRWSMAAVARLGRRG